jgi:hypothetical protein
MLATLYLFNFVALLIGALLASSLFFDFLLQFFLHTMDDIVFLRFRPAFLLSPVSTELIWPLLPPLPEITFFSKRV